ncbi:MFS family permease [Altererythrobacter atlanticus]|uniref:L-galactonate transporter n=1 Tax=Croceibacterium atlanticum TaxID=1267766 RepID=A0A0F7KVV8_9SPHN|nr:MFS transporter [Croceibacterium atlanticum]AKH42890.1 L-galactonate transporter [Croceibacterium atlanticum]MBB5731670.1 MFS family permease [Croceibacterium atlanticum]
MSANPKAPPKTNPFWALFVLFLANVFNQGDRILFGTVVDPIGRDLAISDTEMSLASGLFFVLFNLVGGLFIARLVDRGNRVRILAIGVAVWSLATAATGLATGFSTLALARIVVGIGEATAVPAAMSLIPDLFRMEARGRAVAVFQTSSFVGIVGGTIIAGVLAAAMGWRSMFIVCGLSGLSVTALLLFSVREPEREEQADRTAIPAYWRDLVDGCGRVLHRPGFLLLMAGFGAGSMMTFVLAAWAPTFLLRSHDVPLAQVGLVIGPAVGLGGIFGALASGMFADRMVRKRNLAADMLKVPLWSIPLSLPFMAGFIFLPWLAAAMACAAVMNFLLSMATPTAMNFVVNSVAPGDRGLSATLLLAATGLVGGTMGPFIVGLLSDLLAPRLGDESLRIAIAAMLATPVVATIFLVAAYRRATKAAIDEAGATITDPQGLPAGR